MGLPGRNGVQLAVWLDGEVGLRFRRYCERQGIRKRVAAQEAIALYLDAKFPRAGALDAADGTPSMFPLAAPGREFDSRDGDPEK